MDVIQLTLEQIKQHNNFSRDLGAALIRAITDDEPAEALEVARDSLAHLPRVSGLSAPGRQAFRLILALREPETKGGDVDG